MLQCRILKNSACSLFSAAHFLNLSSHIPRHELPHRIRRLLLHFGGNVGVGAKGETHVEVPQHAGDRLDVHAVLQSNCGECVSEIS